MGKQQTKAKSIRISLAFAGFLLLFCSQKIFAQDNRIQFPHFLLSGEYGKSITDSIPADWASLIEYRTPADIFVQKHLATPSEEMLSRDSVPSIIDYKATDSSVFSVKKNMFYLYKDGEVKDPENTIDAATIAFNRSTNIVTAWGNKDPKDTTNAISGRPTLLNAKDNSKTILDTAYFNIKTQKGIFRNSFYNEGEMYVHAEVAKKVDSNSIFVKDARFTTCNLEPPHFDIHAWKLKMITGKLAVSGPAFPEFEGVPMPIIIPFGIYPLEQGRHSGLIAPVFQQDNINGLGITGLGYYKVINDNWDITTRVNLYSYGGYMISVSPEYYKRYNYRGTALFTYMFSKQLNSAGTITQNEYNTSKQFQLNWSHSMDAKAHPGVNFSASVNAGSTRFNSLQTQNPYQNIQNTMNSSITYSRTWDDGKYNLSVSASGNENTLNHSVNLSLPNITFSRTAFNPFKNSETSVGKAKWYENISIGYSGTFNNNLSFFDTAKNNTIHRLLDTMAWGATHNIPITLTLPALGPFIFTPSVSYQQNWYGTKGLLSWDDTRQKVDTAFQKGFFLGQQASVGISMNTRIFGLFKFNKGDLQIRHELRPSIGFSYTPAMNGGSWDSVQIQPAQIQQRGVYYRPMMNYSVYQVSPSNLAGTFSNIPSGAITFSLNNIFQGKIKNDKDSSGNSDSAYKKFNILQGLSLSTSYNLLADSSQWAPVSISMNTTLFNNKLSLNSSMTLDQYAYNKYGQRTGDLLWTDGKLGAITSGTLSLSTSFSSKKTQSQSDSDRVAQQPDPNMPMDQQMAQMNYVRDHASEFVDFNIPWNVQLSYSMSFNRQINPDYSGFHNVFNSSLNLNGDFSVSPKWKAGGSMYYDVINRKVGMMTLFFTRDMHCWQMAINITPIGAYKSFSIVINPKSGILRDLRINRSRTFYSTTY